ncbi:MAG: 4-hydroxy-tetrahydrodipicolinate synthase [Verrucomicrobiota bacterium]|nr:4-hydroxy-tetrahydrodipicolinate synthase [Verrucomicrobiota bacterium]
MWRGAFVALVTPFDRKGRIDQQTLERLVAWQISSGTDGIVCCGTTGEGMTLSEKERETVLTICLAVAEGKIPIVVGTGTADTRQSVRLTERMQKLGANGCLIPVPYYNKPTQRGVVLHMMEIAKVGLPMIPYNNPGRSMKLELETVEEVGKIPAVVAYKDSSGDMQFVRKVKSFLSVPLFSGDDHLTCETLQEGGDGAISVIGNLFPAEWKQMIRSAFRKEWQEARRIFEELSPVCQALFLETNPQCVKFALSLMGKCRSELRLPLLPPTLQTQAQIAQVLQTRNLIT